MISSQFVRIWRMGINMSKLIVLSADAMITEDLEVLEHLPNYRRFIAGGSLIRNVKSVYPTITYPCHTTMRTGVYPDKHGIIRNDIFDPGAKNRPWQWFNSAINPNVTDIFTAAKTKGLTTAAVFWPVTGNHPNIDYLIDEYWTQDDSDTIESAFRRSGSVGKTLDIVRRNAPLLEGMERKHPFADEFIIKCSCDIITELKPDLLMIHPANVDSYRHRFGVHHQNIRQGILETDFWIGELMRATMIAGTYEQTNFALVSDHGQIDIKRIINPNIIFARDALLQTDDNGDIISWNAVCVSGGASAWIYLKNPHDSVLYEKVYNILCGMRDDGVYGISKIFTAEEVAESEHLRENFSFVIETDGYSAFGEAASGSIATSIDTSDYRTSKGTHGHLPSYGPQVILAAKGPDFRENVVLGHGRLVDEAPTFAKVLGIDLPNTDGECIDEILK